MKPDWLKSGTTDSWQLENGGLVTYDFGRIAIGDNNWQNYRIDIELSNFDFNDALTVSFYVSGLKSDTSYAKSNYFVFHRCSADVFVIEPSFGIGKRDTIDSYYYCASKNRTKIAIEAKDNSVTLFDQNGKPLYKGSLTSNANKTVLLE